MAFAGNESTRRHPPGSSQNLPSRPFSAPSADLTLDPLRYPRYSFDPDSLMDQSIEEQLRRIYVGPEFDLGFFRDTRLPFTPLREGATVPGMYRVARPATRAAGRRVRRTPTSKHTGSSVSRAKQVRNAYGGQPSTQERHPSMLPIATQPVSRQGWTVQQRKEELLEKGLSPLTNLIGIDGYFIERPRFSYRPLSAGMPPIAEHVYGVYPGSGYGAMELPSYPPASSASAASGRHGGLEIERRGTVPYEDAALGSGNGRVSHVTSRVRPVQNDFPPFHGAADTRRFDYPSQDALGSVSSLSSTTSGATSHPSARRGESPGDVYFDEELRLARDEPPDNGPSRTLRGAVVAAPRLQDLSPLPAADNAHDRAAADAAPRSPRMSSNDPSRYSDAYLSTGARGLPVDLNELAQHPRRRSINALLDHLLVLRLQHHQTAQPGTDSSPREPSTESKSPHPPAKKSGNSANALSPRQRPPSSSRPRITSFPRRPSSSQNHGRPRSSLNSSGHRVGSTPTASASGGDGQPISKEDEMYARLCRRYRRCECCEARMPPDVLVPVPPSHGPRKNATSNSGRAGGRHGRRAPHADGSLSLPRSPYADASGGDPLMAAAGVNYIPYNHKGERPRGESLHLVRPAAGGDGGAAVPRGTFFAVHSGTARPANADGVDEDASIADEAESTQLEEGGMDRRSRDGASVSAYASVPDEAEPSSANLESGRRLTDTAPDAASLAVVEESCTDGGKKGGEDSHGQNSPTTDSSVADVSPPIKKPGEEEEAGLGTAAAEAGIEMDKVDMDSMTLNGVDTLASGDHNQTALSKQESPSAETANRPYGLSPEELNALLRSSVFQGQLRILCELEGPLRERLYREEAQKRLRKLSGGMQEAEAAGRRLLLASEAADHAALRSPWQEGQFLIGLMEVFLRKRRATLEEEQQAWGDMLEAATAEAEIIRRQTPPPSAASRAAAEEGVLGSTTTRDGDARDGADARAAETASERPYGLSPEELTALLNSSVLQGQLKILNEIEGPLRARLYREEAETRLEKFSFGISTSEEAARRVLQSAESKVRASLQRPFRYSRDCLLFTELAMQEWKTALEEEEEARAALFAEAAEKAEEIGRRPPMPTLTLEEVVEEETASRRQVDLTEQLVRESLEVEVCIYAEEYTRTDLEFGESVGRAVMDRSHFLTSPVSDPLTPGQELLDNDARSQHTTHSTESYTEQRLKSLTASNPTTHTVGSMPIKQSPETSISNSSGLNHSRADAAHDHGQQLSAHSEQDVMGGTSSPFAERNSFDIDPSAMEVATVTDTLASVAHDKADLTEAAPAKSVPQEHRRSSPPLALRSPIDFLATPAPVSQQNSRDEAVDRAGESVTTDEMGSLPNLQGHSRSATPSVDTKVVVVVAPYVSEKKNISEELATSDGKNVSAAAVSSGQNRQRRRIRQQTRHRGAVASAIEMDDAGEIRGVDDDTDSLAEATPHAHRTNTSTGSHGTPSGKGSRSPRPWREVAEVVERYGTPPESAALSSGELYMEMEVELTHSVIEDEVLVFHEEGSTSQQRRTAANLQDDEEGARVPSISTSAAYPRGGKDGYSAIVIEPAAETRRFLSPLSTRSDVDSLQRTTARDLSSGGTPASAWQNLSSTDSRGAGYRAEYERPYGRQAVHLPPALAGQTQASITSSQRGPHPTSSMSPRSSSSLSSPHVADDSLPSSSKRTPVSPPTKEREALQLQQLSSSQRGRMRALTTPYVYGGVSNKSPKPGSIKDERRETPSRDTTEVIRTPTAPTPGAVDGIERRDLERQWRPESHRHGGLNTTDRNPQQKASTVPLETYAGSTVNSVLRLDPAVPSPNDAPRNDVVQVDEDELPSVRLSTSNVSVSAAERRSPVAGKPASAPDGSLESAALTPQTWQLRAQCYAETDSSSKLKSTATVGGRRPLTPEFVRSVLAGQSKSSISAVSASHADNETGAVSGKDSASAMGKEGDIVVQGGQLPHSPFTGKAEDRFLHQNASGQRRQQAAVPHSHRGTTSGRGFLEGPASLRAPTAYDEANVSTQLISVNAAAGEGFNGGAPTRSSPMRVRVPSPHPNALHRTSDSGNSGVSSPTATSMASEEEERRDPPASTYNTRLMTTMANSSLRSDELKAAPLQKAVPMNLMSSTSDSGMQSAASQNSTK